MATAAALVLAGVSTAVQVAGTLAAGKAQQSAANYQAAQLDQQAGQARASSQRDAANQQRTTAYALSRAQAVAAAGGGNTLDPTVVNTEQNIAGQGEYNTLTSLFNGEEKARGMEQEADTARYQGGLDESAAQTKAIGTIASSGSSMLMKYGNPFTASNDASGGSFGGKTAMYG